MASRRSSSSDATRPRSTPIADTDPATPLGDTFKIVPGTYEFVARGNGFGLERFTEQVQAPGQVRDMPVNMSDNLASSDERGDRVRATASTSTS